MERSAATDDAPRLPISFVLDPLVIDPADHTSYTGR
jgi:hypothetical protein